METEKLYCSICHKEYKYEILQNEDNAEFRDNSHAVLWDNSHAVLWDNSHAVLWDNSHAVLWDNSHAVLRGNSHAELRGNSHAELWDNSHAVLRGNSHAVLWGNSHAEGRNPYTSIIIRSPSATAKGGTVIGQTIIPARQWLEKCGVSIKKGYAILYKSTKRDFTTRNEVSFELGMNHETPDWDANYPDECGKGIHYSPTVTQAKMFRDEGVYIACRVKVSDMADLPAFAQYPDKIRAKGGYALYQVDADGKRIDTKISKPNRDSRGRFIKACGG